MKILSWNVRGAGNKSYPVLIFHLTKKFKFDLLDVFEPRISGIRAARVIRHLGSPCFHVVHANGFAGGVWLLLKDDICRVEILQDVLQFIHGRVIPLDGSTL
ncbi:Endonuclease/exonuclease/phosphatase superfamily [Sesbania bispinosa]|nr:Endonuclease/exonuclease/phosphatase superfamily [Sesbania bispinosa]